MIEPHPPHATPHTWRDFFIHIATIVVGLLIAIGLEQTVEWLHHRHQLKEVRAQLEEERELDARILVYDKAIFQQIEAELNADAALLQRRADGDKTPLKGKLRYVWFGVAMRDGAWQAARQSSAIALMPADELQIVSYRYFDFASFMQSSLVLFPTMHEAAAIVHDRPDGDFSEDDSRDLLRLTHQAQGQLALARKYLQICIDFALGNERPRTTSLDRPVVRLDELPE